jgi:hypothetical protein
VPTGETGPGQARQLNTPPGHAVDMMPMGTNQAETTPATDEANPGKAHRVVFSDPESATPTPVRDPGVAGEPAQAPVFSNPG